jgi:hypothetical protein
MAWKIDSDPAVYTIRQSARRFRGIFIGLLVSGGVAAIATIATSKQVDTMSITCDHAKHGCTFDYTTPMPLADANLRGAKVVHKNDEWYLSLDTRDADDGKPHEFQACHTEDAGAVAGITAHRDELRAYLGDPAHAPIAITCATFPSGPSPAILVIAPLGWLVIAFLFRYWSFDIRARFDRTAKRVTIKGRRWFARRWSIDAPLSEVERVETSSIYMGRGQRMYLLRAVMRDGRTPILWTPTLRGGLDNVNKREAELNAWLAAAKSHA